MTVVQLNAYLDVIIRVQNYDMAIVPLNCVSNRTICSFSSGNSEILALRNEPMTPEAYKAFFH